MYDFKNGETVHVFARWDKIQPLNGIVRGRFENAENKDEVIFKIEVTGAGKPEHLDYVYIPKNDCRVLIVSSG